MPKSIRGAPTSPRPWESAEAARAELGRRTSSARLLRWMDASGFFGPGPSPRDGRADVYAVGRAIRGVLNAMERLPPAARAAGVLAALDTRALEAIAASAGSAADAIPRISRPQNAANVAVHVAARNGWPRPTARELALLAIACGLERPCGDERWSGSRLPTWKRRLQRAGPE